MILLLPPDTVTHIARHLPSTTDVESLLLAYPHLVGYLTTFSGDSKAKEIIRLRAMFQLRPGKRVFHVKEIMDAMGVPHGDAEYLADYLNGFKPSQRKNIRKMMRMKFLLATIAGKGFPERDTIVMVGTVPVEEQEFLEEYPDILPDLVSAKMRDLAMDTTTSVVKVFGNLYGFAVQVHNPRLATNGFTDVKDLEVVGVSSCLTLRVLHVPDRFQVRT